MGKRCVSGSLLLVSRLAIGRSVRCGTIRGKSCGDFFWRAHSILLKNMGIDPAIAGGVILTTITDAIGFLVFLGAATKFLL